MNYGGFKLGSKTIMEFKALVDEFPKEEGWYVLKINSGYALCPTLCQCLECICSLYATHWMRLEKPEY